MTGIKRIDELTTPSFLKPSVYYFLFYAAAASLSPFLALYYQSLGLDGRQIGVLASLPSIVMIFSIPYGRVLPTLIINIACSLLLPRSARLHLCLPSKHCMVSVG